MLQSYVGSSAYLQSSRTALSSYPKWLSDLGIYFQKGFSSKAKKVASQELMVEQQISDLKSERQSSHLLYVS